MPNQRCNAEGGKLLKHPAIAPIIGKANARAEAVIERAIEQYAVSRERNVAELARMAYATLHDFTRVVNGHRVVDTSQATEDQLRALSEITVDDYVDGRGENARQVKRTRIKLHDKGMAIERLNKMFGWIIDRNEVGKPGEFGKMSDEELEGEMLAYLMEAGLAEEQARALLRQRRGAGEPTQ